MLVVEPRLHDSRKVERGLMESLLETQGSGTRARLEEKGKSCRSERANVCAIGTNHDSPKTRKVDQEIDDTTLGNDGNSTDSETEQTEEIRGHSSPCKNDRMTQRSSIDCSCDDLPSSYPPMKNVQMKMTRTTREVECNSIRIPRTQKIRTVTVTGRKHITQNNTASPSLCLPTTGNLKQPEPVDTLGQLAEDGTSRYEVANSPTTESSTNSRRLQKLPSASHRDGNLPQQIMNNVDEAGKSESLPSIHPKPPQNIQSDPRVEDLTSETQPLPTATEIAGTNKLSAPSKSQSETLHQRSGTLSKVAIDSNRETSARKPRTPIKPESSREKESLQRKNKRGSSSTMCPSMPAKMMNTGSSKVSTPTSAFLQQKKVASPPSAGTKRKRSGSVGSSSSSQQQSKPKGQSSGRWTQAEHQAFLEGLSECGREWKKVALKIPTRTSAQIRSHAQKYFAKLQRDQEASAAAATAAASSTSSFHHPIGHITPIGSSNPFLYGETGPLSGTIVTNTAMTSSVRKNVERILSNPRAAQREVEDTMEALRERYRQLQQRLEERRKQREARRKLRKCHSTSELSSMSSPILSPSNRPLLPKNQQRGDPKLNAKATAAVRLMSSPASGDENSSVSSNVSSIAASRTDLGNEEIIALEVLGGSLPRGDSVNDLLGVANETASVEEVDAESYRSNHPPQKTLPHKDNDTSGKQKDTGSNE